MLLSLLTSEFISVHAGLRLVFSVMYICILVMEEFLYLTLMPLEHLKFPSITLLFALFVMRAVHVVKKSNKEPAAPYVEQVVEPKRVSGTIHSTVKHSVS